MCRLINAFELQLHLEDRRYVANQGRIKIIAMLAHCSLDGAKVEIMHQIYPPRLNALRYPRGCMSTTLPTPEDVSKLLKRCRHQSGPRQSVDS